MNRVKIDTTLSAAMASFRSDNQNALLEHSPYRNRTKPIITNGPSASQEHQSMNGQANSLTSRRARKPCAGWRARRSPRKSLSPPLRHSSGYDSRRNCLTLWAHGPHQKF